MYLFFYWDIRAIKISAFNILKISVIIKCRKDSSNSSCVL